jgi:hypothetical protein
MAANSKSSSILELMNAIKAKKNLEEAEKNQEMQGCLDQQPDLPSDEQGDAEQLGDTKFTTGKYKGKEFRDVYVGNKNYTEWTRQNVSAAQTKFSVNMLEFRLYVEMRDKAKQNRIEKIKEKSKPKMEERKSATRRSFSEAGWEEIMAEPTQEEKKMMAALEAQEIQNKLERMKKVQVELEKEFITLLSQT